MSSITSPPIDVDGLLTRADAAYRARDFESAEALRRPAARSRSAARSESSRRRP